MQWSMHYRKIHDHTFFVLDFIIVLTWLTKQLSLIVEDFICFNCNDVFFFGKLKESSYLLCYFRLDRNLNLFISFIPIEESKDQKD